MTKMVTKKWMEGILIIFSMCRDLVEGQVAMYGYVAKLFAMRYLLLEGNMPAIDSPPWLDVQTPCSNGMFAKYPKDPFLPWISPRELVQKCHDLVKVDQFF